MLRSAPTQDPPAERASPWPMSAAGLALLAIATLIALSPRVLLYDERYYMQSAWFLAERRDFVALMRTPLDLAAGPLYAYLHVLAMPLTGLQVPAARFVNLACLMIAIAASARGIGRLGYTAAPARAAMLLAVPMVGPTAGLALTELPALALASLAALGAVEGLAAATPARSRWWWGFAGIGAGFAVLGRQTYLPALAGFAALGWAYREHAWRAAGAAALALACVAPMVALWGGLSPPSNTAAGPGFVPPHAVLALIYLAAACALIAPGFFAAPLRLARDKPLGVGTAGAVLAATALVLLDLPIASRVVAVAPAALQLPLQAGLRAVLALVAALFVLAAAVNGIERGHDRRFALLAGLTLALTATAAGIGHQFSSRYVLAAFPFALLMLQRWLRPGPWAAARLLFGAGLGLASLAAYYWNAPPTDPSFRLSASPDIIARMPLARSDRTEP